MYYLNNNLKNLVRVFDQNDRTNYLRLDLNENPGGLPEDLLKAVLSKLTPNLISQYPETKHFKRFLSNYLNTDEEHLCLSNGSSEAIRYVIQAFTSENGKIVGVTPSYFMFQVYSEMYGRKFVPVAYNEDLSMDVDKIISELSCDTQLLILLNPNNPMGNVYTESDFCRILAVCKKNKITLLIDEAYLYFYPHSFINYALKERRVLVTRTFSKLFSMAGCRLGYVAGHPDDIKFVQKLCTPHNTNVLAMMLAEEVLKNPKIIDLLIEKYREGRAYLLAELDKNGYQYKGEAGNFLFIKSKTDPQVIVERMKKEKKILIKMYKNVGCFGNCLRVTIGEKKYMEHFISSLIEIDNQIIC